MLGGSACRLLSMMLDIWRGRAEEARALADQMTDPKAKATMFQIAEGYDTMAEHALARATGVKPKPSK